jgi:diguanylate cyclase (GGDEF)-like protein
MTVSLVRKGDQTPDYFIAVIEDISPRKRVEAERDELIQSLEARVLERTADLEQLSRTDALTGIANRRRFDEQLISEWDRCVREHQPISIVLIDIDHFKGLNDALGHWDADRSLVLLAKVLTESTRRSIDIAARYGGDEFILLLPATGPEGAMKVATEVQQGMNRYALADPGSRESGEVTVSQGVATAWPSRKGASNSLMLAADRALYRAKEAGRNRIETEGSLQESVEGV